MHSWSLGGRAERLSVAGDVPAPSCTPDVPLYRVSVQWISGRVNSTCLKNMVAEHLTSGLCCSQGVQGLDPHEVFPWSYVVFLREPISLGGNTWKHPFDNPSTIAVTWTCPLSRRCQTMVIPPIPYERNPIWVWYMVVHWYTIQTSPTTFRTLMWVCAKMIIAFVDHTGYPTWHKPT